MWHKQTFAICVSVLSVAGHKTQRQEEKFCEWNGKKRKRNREERDTSGQRCWLSVAVCVILNHWSLLKPSCLNTWTEKRQRVRLRVSFQDTSFTRKERDSKAVLSLCVCHFFTRDWIAVKANVLIPSPAPDSRLGVLLLPALKVQK